VAWTEKAKRLVGWLRTRRKGRNRKENKMLSKNMMPQEVRWRSHEEWER